MRRGLLRALALGAVPWLAAAGAAAQQPGDSLRGRSACDVCHAEIEFLRQNTDSMPRARAVNVADATIAASAHAKLTCVNCHTGFARFPHKAGETRTCAACHDRQSEAWSRGAHKPEPGKGGADCTQCHGVHDVAASTVRNTRAGMAGMNRNCIACHQTEKLSAKSPHAQAVLCASCHGAHDTQPAHNRDSRLWANEQLQTCGTCHNKVATRWMKQDVHAQALLTRRPQQGKGIGRRAPACTDCHGAHGMQIGDSTLVQAASERCAECHTRYAGAYADTYHGQASELGSRKAAACADCHRAHAIQPASQPTSSVAKANLTKTCGRCHPTANAGFTRFDAHVDPHDSENPLIYWAYKFMNLLLFGTMGFFGLHTLLWVNRLGMEAAARKRAQQTPRQPGDKA